MKYLLFKISDNWEYILLQRFSLSPVVSTQI